MELVRYLTTHAPLPPAAGLYDYVLAGNGLSLRAERQGLRVLAPIAPCRVRGLPDLEPEITLLHPRVPAALTQKMLTAAQQERNEKGRPIEVMYHLSWIDDRWELAKPAQIQSRAAVEPVGPYTGTSYATYLVEVHSHHGLECHDFSGIDDESEGTKFRFFGLLDNIFRQPRLQLRLNVYGYRFDVPAELVFELPDALEADDDTKIRTCFD